MCPECNKEIVDVTDRYCRSCRADLRNLHTQCDACNFSAMVHLVDSPTNGCPMCANPQFRSQQQSA
jgi:hypothetical protein